MPLIDDRFANVITAEVTMSAADTITFTEIATGVSLGQQLGLVLDRVEYTPDRNNAQTGVALLNSELAAVTDQLSVGITTSELVTELHDTTDRRIIDAKTIAQMITTSGRQALMVPLVSEFSPPLILASPRLFLAMDSAGFGAAARCRCRIFFRYVKLTPQEYLEVAETFLITS